MIPFNVVEQPTKIVTTRKRAHVRGSIVELFGFIEALEPGKCVEVKDTVLTTSNIMSLYQEGKRRGFKLHCVCNENKRLLWVEKVQGGVQ